MAIRLALFPQRPTLFPSSPATPPPFTAPALDPRSQTGPGPFEVASPSLRPCLHPKGRASARHGDRPKGQQVSEHAARRSESSMAEAE
ncbi:hypothetical protein [Thermoflexus sp.]|uniref:hypothetical protein n=1 Tax=Thermoflexus sp. TaxID=1969742 RepID=UPI001833FDD9|nr:hypothetical protein [Thermoflexus sp.]